VALVSDLVAVGVAPRRAKALGDTFGTLEADNSNPAITTSYTYIKVRSGVGPGVTLPPIPLSNTKRHVVLNSSGGAIDVHVGNAVSEQIIFFNGFTGPSVTAVTVPDLAAVTLVKVDNNLWVAY